jgi:hypothetical protein
MYLNSLLHIDNITVRQEILETAFTCDLAECKGACCTLESQYGAPLEKNEIKIIEDILPEIITFLPEEKRMEIELNGFWEEKHSSLMIKSIDNRDCVFSYYENGIARCAIEKLYKEGVINFQKPISCHLFPIRISNFGGGVLRYEKFKECDPALENGKKLNKCIAEFCKDSLTRLYGTDWFEKLSGYMRS